MANPSIFVRVAIKPNLFIHPDIEKKLVHGKSPLQSHSECGCSVCSRRAFEPVDGGQNLHIFGEGLIVAQNFA
ncbi:MAG: hypothetical protein ABW166_15115 [Sedimenticola sp.]